MLEHRLQMLEREVRERARWDAPASSRVSGLARSLSGSPRNEELRPLELQRKDAVSWSARPQPEQPLQPEPSPTPPTDAEKALALNDLDQDPSIARLLEEFNGIAASGDRRALQAFGESNGAMVVGELGDDALQPDENGKLWWVEVDTVWYGMLLPAPDVVQNWDKFYRHMGGRQAKIELGKTFDLHAGDTLRINSPAWARRASLDEGFQRVRRGVIQGI
jgi:hypothetical protein